MFLLLPLPLPLLLLLPLLLPKSMAEGRSKGKGKGRGKGKCKGKSKKIEKRTLPILIMTRIHRRARYILRIKRIEKGILFYLITGKDKGKGRGKGRRRSLSIFHISRIESLSVLPIEKQSLYHL